MKLETIRQELEFLKDYNTVVYGSYVTGDFREGSDIDIAVITWSGDESKNIEIWSLFPGKAKPIFDIRIFELLPLKIKALLMTNYKVLFGDVAEISEYFYFYRKIWDDCKYRIMDGYHTSYKDKIKAMRRYERIRKQGMRR